MVGRTRQHRRHSIRRETAGVLQDAGHVVVTRDHPGLRPRCPIDRRRAAQLFVYRIGISAKLGRKRIVIEAHRNRSVSTLQLALQTPSIADRGQAAISVRVSRGYFALCAILLRDSPRSLAAIRIILRPQVRTDSPQVYHGAEVLKSHDEPEGLARSFTRAMHSISMAPAMAWPSAISLSKCKTMLDVAGGSGVHSIGAVTRGSLRVIK